MIDRVWSSRWVTVGLATTLIFLGVGTWPTAAPARALLPVRSDLPDRVVQAPGARPEAPLLAPLAASGSYDPDRTADKYAEFQKAAALPLAPGNPRWQDVGPSGVDSAPGYPASAEQFMRIAGMVSALAVDPADVSGNTVYMGNMGGLWKSLDGGAHWSNLSDGKIPSAAVGAIALDPSHPGDIYVGTGIAYLTLSGEAYGTGLYVSHDGGQSFTRPSPNVSGWAVTVIKVAPTAVFVGTNHGLYRSADRGSTVRKVDLPTSGDHTSPAPGPYANWITDVAVKPSAPSEVTVGVGFYRGQEKLSDGSVAAPGNGLYRSVTSGTPGSFAFMASTSQLASPESSPDPVGKVTLAYGQTAADANVLWAAVSDAGLSRGLFEFGDQVPNLGSTQFNGIFRSPDDGASWQVKVTPTSLATAPNSTLTGFIPLGYAPGVQASYELWLATDPQVADQVYFGLEEAYQTIGNAGGVPGLAAVDVIERYADICGFFSLAVLPAGASCPAGTPLYGGLTTHPDQHAAALTQTGNKVRIYSANDGGTYRQDSHTPLSGGRFDNDAWTALNTVRTLEPWHVGMLPSGEILTALQDNGGALNRPGEPGVNIGVGDGLFVIPTSNSDVFYFSTPNAGLMVTADHGHSYRNINPRVTGAAFLSPIAMDPTDPNHLVAAGQNVKETLLGPNTTSSDWTQSFDAGTDPANVDSLTSTTVPWAASALDVRGAAVYGAICAICRAVDENFQDVHAKIETNIQPGCTPVKGGTACWHIAASRGLDPGYVQKVVIDPADNHTIYASVIERQFLGYPGSRVPGRVFVSHDAGESFSDLTGNLPRGSVWGLVLRAGQLIAATDTGVFTATAGARAWSRLAAGLPATQVRDAWLDPSGRHLLVSAYGRGVWMLDFGAAAPGSNQPGTGALPNTAAYGLPTALLGGGLLLLAALALVGWRRRAPLAA